MFRIPGVVVVICALAAGVQGSSMQFSVNGVPVDGSVQEVPQDVVTIDIYVTPDGPFEAFWVDFFATGPWAAPEPLPKIGGPPPGNDTALLDSGDVTMLSVWDNEYAVAYWDDFWGIWTIASFLVTGFEDEPQAVAAFDVDLSSYPVSTTLNLEFDWAEAGTVIDVLVPLVLHVTPEPATVGLLALGGLVVVRRKR